MSHEPQSNLRDPLLERGPTSSLPQDKFPKKPLSTVVEPQSDGSQRCIFYPDEVEDEATPETCWLATDHDLVVSTAQWR